MATTAGTVFPMAPIARKGHEGSALSVYPIDPGVAMQAGDILIIDAGTRDMQVDAAPTANIFGVAILAPKTTTTTASTIDRDAQPGPDTAGEHHVLNVALAFQSQLFAGNVIDTSTGDHTGVYADDLRRQLDIAASTQGFACVEDSTGTGPVVFTLDYITPQFDNQASPVAWNTGRAAGVGIINPRVTFVFIATATIFGN